MEYEIVRGDMDDTAAGYLGPALAHDPFYGLPELAMQVRQGKAGLFHIYECCGQRHLASFTLAVNERANGTEEIEITAGGARTNGPDLTAVCLRFARAVAQEAGIGMVRTATRKRGVGRLLERHGMALDEYVYKMEVAADE